MKNTVDEAIHVRMGKDIFEALVHTIRGLKANSEQLAQNIGSM